MLTVGTCAGDLAGQAMKSSKGGPGVPAPPGQVDEQLLASLNELLENLMAESSRGAPPAPQQSSGPERSWRNVRMQQEAPELPPAVKDKRVAEARSFAKQFSDSWREFHSDSS